MCKHPGRGSPFTRNSTGICPTDRAAEKAEHASAALAEGMRKELERNTCVMIKINHLGNRKKHTVDVQGTGFQGNKDSPQHGTKLGKLSIFQAKGKWDQEEKRAQEECSVPGYD